MVYTVIYNKEGEELIRVEGANLRGADLYGADLEGANLYGADLYGADLEGANLRGADLEGANLYGANLRGADLEGANLRGADLEGANLYGADLEGANLPIFCKWSVSGNSEKVTIGCKTKTYKEWDEWFAGEEKYNTKRGTDDFKRIYACYMYYKLVYNS